MVAHQAPLSMGFSRWEHWSGLLCPPPRGLPNTGMEPAFLTSLALAGMFFITSTASGKFLVQAGMWGKGKAHRNVPGMTTRGRTQALGTPNRYLSTLWPNSSAPEWRSTKALTEPESESRSVQLSRSVVSDSLWPHESQHARPPCPLPTPRVYPNSCPSSRWCHPAISSSVVPFSSCPQSLPASGSSPMSQLFPWGGQSTGVSAAASVLPMNSQDWSPLGWCPTLRHPMDYGNSPGQDTRMGSLSLLQGIFPTQGSNAGLPHCRWILYQLSHKGSPRILEWVAYPFSSESSGPRNRTGVSCSADGFVTNWAVREALQNQRQHRQECSLERPLCPPLSLGPGRGCTLIKVAPYPDRACIADEWNSLRVKWANR